MSGHHSNELLKAVLVHAQERDMLRAWSGHIAAFKATSIVTNWKFKWAETALRASTASSTDM